MIGEHGRCACDFSRKLPAILFAVGLFLVCALRYVEVPGLYMDAINPDYLVGRWLNPELQNPAWTLPGPELPLLGNLYHGTQNLYFGLLTYSIFGTSIISARLTHALFGAAIVALLYLNSRRVTGQPWLALVMALGLASDMAFIGSFRTQSYIVLGGQVWMLVATYLALGSLKKEVAGAWSLVVSGACMGLAVYGYFVHLFFAPVVAWVAVFGPGARGAGNRFWLWALGFAFGMLPYVIGYAWMVVDLGGWGAFADWLRAAVTGLKPMSGSPTYFAGLMAGLRDSRLALAGIGNEMMMTGGAISVLEANIRTWLLVLACTVCIAGGVANWRSRPGIAKAGLAMAMLPLGYVLIAAIFGGRLWVHHYTVLVGISYLVMATALGMVIPLMPCGRIRLVSVLIIAAILLTSNFHQQNRVFHSLERTGGVGTSTEMLDVLARSAIAERREAIYYFPEWGFFMPFAFLTSNRVKYELDLSANALRRQRGVFSEVRVAFWQRREQARYEAVLREAGVRDVRLYTFSQRDGVPAFFLLAGRL